jgi:hypothetical protein
MIQRTGREFTWNGNWDAEAIKALRVSSYYLMYR